VKNETTIQRAEATSKRRSVVLLGLGLGMALAALVALAGAAQKADAAFTEKVLFVSDRTSGTGVSNPTGDAEIFRMNPDGTGVRQLTFNKADDFGPILSPDGTRITYMTFGEQTSNPEGDWEVYVMNASDGKGKRNLTDNGADIYDFSPLFSPGGRRIAYVSYGKQDSNQEGDYEIYRMGALDGTGQTNLSNNGAGVFDHFLSGFSSDGSRIFYQSNGVQYSNPQGDNEIYRLNTSDGKGQKNLTDNDAYDGVYPD